MKKTIIIGIPLLAVLLWGATSGNLQWTQLASGSRHGTATKGQSSDGTGTSGNCAKYDASGNLVDAGITCASGAGSPLTTKGDLYTFGSANARQAVGTNGQTLYANSGATNGIDWEAPLSLTTTGTSGAASFTPGNPNVLNIPQYAGTGFANPMTTQGDLIYGAASGTPTRLPAGTSGYLLQTNGTGSAPTWVVAPSGGGGGLTQISQQVLGSPAASVTFTGIPGTYSTLKVTVLGATTAVGSVDDVNCAMNGTAVYAQSRVFYNSTQQANAAICGSINGAGGVTNGAGTIEMTIIGYAGTAFIKRFSSLSGHYGNSNVNSPAYQYSEGTMQTLTAAVTSLTFTSNAGANFVTGSVFTLYGVQ